MSIERAVAAILEHVERKPPSTATRNLASSHTIPAWPAPLAQPAFHGPAGEIVRLIEPHSESDPAALLVQVLAMFGNMVGRGAYYLTEADRQYSNIYVALVGQTSKARKGTSYGQARRVFDLIDPVWAGERIVGGLASGEGLIWAVRDPLEGADTVKHGKPAAYNNLVADAGVQDKRLLVYEPELARVLQVSERHGSTASAIIRQAWDTGDLRVMTKKDPARATGAHISIIGHITQQELRRTLTDTAIANGFANRFLWTCSRRSKLLPEGGALDSVDFSPVQAHLRAAVNAARQVERMNADAEARAIWWEVYPSLSEGAFGLFGAATSRAEAQVIRLACIYGLLDGSAIVRAEHLLAALAVWIYAEDSARYIFGDSLGDASADEILRALRGAKDGMTRSEIRELFNRHKPSAEIERALTVLSESGKAWCRSEATAGRDAERWFCFAPGAYGAFGAYGATGSEEK